MTKKEKMIKVLLWNGSDEPSNLSGVCMTALEQFGGDTTLLWSEASGLRCAADPDDLLNYEESCLEAAYRLIEGDAKLRKKWFGSR